MGPGPDGGRTRNVPPGCRAREPHLINRTAFPLAGDTHRKLGDAVDQIQAAMRAQAGEADTLAAAGDEVLSGIGTLNLGRTADEGGTSCVAVDAVMTVTVPPGSKRNSAASGAGLPDGSTLDETPIPYSLPRVSASIRRFEAFL